MQGASLKTWSYGALMEQVEQVQLLLTLTRSLALHLTLTLTPSLTVSRCSSC